MINWVQKSISLDDTKNLVTATSLPYAICELLVSLGIKNKEDARDFLKPDLKKHLHNPFLMTDMEKAVLRISNAINNKEKILFHGDYDADGVTTITMAVDGFRLLGVDIDTYTPHRYEDGYGLNPKNMERFCRDYDLIISGDTGIRAFEAATLCNTIGHADLIITDHHEPYIDGIDAIHKAPKGAIITQFEDQFIALPDAYALIDPHRLGDTFPCKSLAGVGIVFMLMYALFSQRKEPMNPLVQSLDLVATGCIADLAPQIDRQGDRLDFLVRTLSKRGIQIMNDYPRTWVNSLREITNNTKDIDAMTIGFSFGPLLNAPGRIDREINAKLSTDFLLETDPEASFEKASLLKEINDERKLQTEVSKSILEDLEKEPEEYYDYSIVVHSNAYETGIAGLIAGKLCEKFYRPSIALAPADREESETGPILLKGSARSIPGIHILDMLDKVRDEIGDFVYGGHEQAAGMTIELDRFEEFRKAFRNACSKHDPSVFVPAIYYDTEIRLEELDMNFMKYINMFEPFGQGNPKPTFLAKNVSLSSLKTMMGGKGARFTFVQDSCSLGGVSFKDGERYLWLYNEGLRKSIDCNVDILFAPGINEWNGEKKVQLFIQDIRLA